MRRNKDVLKIILITLIAIFLMMGTAAILLANHKKSVQQEQKKQAALEALENVPKITPTQAAPSPTPTPVPTATPTPTPAITRAPAFAPEDYWDTWYSRNGLASVNIYDISAESVSFAFSQASDSAGSHVAEADVTARVAGNAAKFTFTDSWGNQASGSMTFDRGQLYVRISTTQPAEGAGVVPAVDSIMSRTKNVSEQPAPTAAPVPGGTQGGAPGDYYFPESDSRYLTEEELSKYNSSELELAKNEIFARHGRKFVTQRIADYFNGKSWYNGTIDAETFDSQQDSIFNEYELANIQRIADIEQQKRNQGN